MYFVIACPKCKKHAQIIQSETSSTRCQLCGKSLDMKHVRVFASCTDLDDAVGRCTALKAHLHGQDDGLKDAIRRGELSGANGSVYGNDNNCGSVKFDDDKLAFEHSVDKRIWKKTATRGLRKTFLQCLSNISGSDGDITIEKLTECLDEHGFDLERVEEYIEKMKREGVLYEPKNGIVRYLNE
ncbi:MAG: hypothetical protein KAH86_10590 [Methanosarcinales archaeon]|nr:hypothetical protein [Methanosarcinales archaeon]